MEKIGFEIFSVTCFENSFRRNDISFVNGLQRKIVLPKGILKKVMENFSKSIFSMMKKYFSSGFFLNLKSLISAI